MGVQIQGDTGNVIATKGTYSGDVSIGGTLTYEDVTNIDSVGLITARQGIKIGTGVGVAASISVDGNAEFAGIVTASTSVSTLAKVGGGVTISESGIEASGVGITCANINGTQIGGRRNIVINGAMTVAQRGTSFTSTGSEFTVDRFIHEIGTSFNFDTTTTQSTDHPNGFKNSLKMTPDSVVTPSGSENGAIRMKLEGQDLQQFAHGTSDATSMTVSFYAKSSSQNSGHVYSIQVRKYDASGNRKYVLKPFTVTDSWQRFSFTFIGDTATAIRDTIEQGMELAWQLSSGPDDLVSATETWTSSTKFQAVSGQNNFMDNTSNEFYLTGVQLEVGSQATAFEHRSFAEELASCQRYCYVTPYGGSSTSGAADEETVQGSFAYNAGDDATVRVMIQFPQPMRSTPTYTGSSTNAKFRSSNTSNNFQLSGLSSFQMKTASNIRSMTLTVTVGSPASMGGSSAGFIEFNQAGGFLKFESELP